MVAYSMSLKRVTQALMTTLVAFAPLVSTGCNWFGGDTGDGGGRREQLADDGNSDRLGKKTRERERVSKSAGPLHKTSGKVLNDTSAFYETSGRVLNDTSALRKSRIVSKDTAILSRGRGNDGKEGSVQRAGSPRERALHDEYITRGRSELKRADYRKAVDTFTEALKMRNSADAHFWRAVSLLALSDASPAFDDLDAVETLAPGTVLALMARAYNLSMGTAEFAKAEKLIDSAISREPGNSWCYFVKSAVCPEGGSNRLPLNDKSRAIAPDELRVLEQRGQILMAAKEHERAKQTFAQVLKINPDAITSISNSGYACFNQKKFADAERFGKTATARDPLYLPSRALLNLIYRERNRKAECYALWNKPSAELDAMPIFHLHRATCYLSWKDYKPARAEIEMFMSAARRQRFTRGELLHAYATQFAIYRALGEARSAFKSAQAARTIAPESVAALGLYVAALRSLGREKAVLAEIDQYLKRPLSKTDRGTALIYKAESYRNLSRLSELETTLKEAHRLLPNDPAIPAVRAYVLISQKKYVQAIQYFQTAEDLGRDKIETKGSIVDCALACGQFDLALKRASELIALYPQEPRGWLLRARAYHAKNDLPKMRADLKHAMSLPYLNSGDYEVAGNVYFHAREPQAAADCLSKVVVLEARSPDVRRKVGAFSKLLTPDVIIQRVAGYVSNEPQNAAAHAALGLCLTSARRNEAAMKELNKAIELETDAANFYVERAQLHVEFGDDEEAIQDFSKAIEELKFESVSAFRGRGAVYAEDGKFDKAIADFTRAINREPFAFDAPYMERGICYRQMNNLPKAIADLELANKYQTLHSSVVRKRLAELYTLAGTPQKALPIFDAALQANPADIQAFEERGDAFMHLKKYKEALADYNQVVRRNENATGAYYKRAMVYRRLGRFQEALADEKHAKSIDQYMLGSDKRR